MTSMKTIPILLLTLAAYGPCIHAAPAANPPGSPNPGDADPMPVPDSTDAPSATLFFTPAVFLPDYYSQPTPAAAVEDNAAYFPQGTATLGSVSDPVAVAQPEDIAVIGAPIPTSTLMESLSTPEPTLQNDGQATSTVPEDGAQVTPAPEVSATPSATSLDVPLVFTISSSAISFSIPASQLSSLVPSTTASHSALNPTQSTTATGKHPTSSESTQTQLTRKAAIIGTILAVASLLGISVCAFCMRCRVPRNVQKNSTDSLIEPFDPNNDDPEKALVDKKPVSPTPSQQSSTTNLPLPSLVANAPSQTPQPAPPQGSAEYGQQRANWQTHAAASTRNASGNFEDVTHILSDKTFAPISGSERSSAASQVSAASFNRVSNGAPSVKAASYATCESRYSTNSAESAVGAAGSQRTSSDGVASTEYLSMSPASTPSPPESPVLRTPKQGVVTVTRTRSHTLDQSPKKRMHSDVSASKSFPVRLSGRMSGIDGVLDEESEWDIAAAYAARYSKGSIGMRSTISEVSEEQEQREPEGEHMETIDIGGRHVIMVTGYAF